MYRNGTKTTSGLKFHARFELSISYMVGHFENPTQILDIFIQFLLSMCRNGQNSTFGQIFNSKFETIICYFLFDYEFWWRLLQNLCVF